MAFFVPKTRRRMHIGCNWDWKCSVVWADFTCAWTIGMRFFQGGDSNPNRNIVGKVLAKSLGRDWRHSVSVRRVSSDTQSRHRPDFHRCRQGQREGVTILIKKLAELFPKCQIIVECRPANEPSWNLLEKIGFKATDELGTGSDDIASYGKSRIFQEQVDVTLLKGRAWISAPDHDRCKTIEPVQARECPDFMTFRFPWIQPPVGSLKH